MEDLRILTDHAEVGPFVQTIRAAADQNKKSLGFLPASVFGEYARKGKLWVAVDPNGNYLGHLLFDLKYPKATVIQMYCVPFARRSGVASALIRSLKENLSEDRYLSIKATVAEDLVESNTFWEGQGFYVQARKQGGETTRRTLLVRITELDVPQLFDRSGMENHGSDSLGLTRVVSTSPPMYLVDLNIVFDVVKRREQHDVAARIFRAAHSGECRLAVSQEMHVELSRAAHDQRTDPMLCLIDSLPWVQLPSSVDADRVMREIGNAVFPEKKFPEQLSRNDLSDVRHVATAVLCRLDGFITRDQRILRASAQMERDHHLRILSPTEFGMLDVSHGSHVELEVGREDRIAVVPYSSEHYDRVRALLHQQCIPPDEIVGSWLPRAVVDRSAAVLVAVHGDAVLGYAMASRFEPRTRCTKIRVSVDEEAQVAPETARVLLSRMMSVEPAEGPSIFDLSVPARQPSLIEAAYAAGFRSAGSAGTMLKVSAGGVAHSENWAVFRSTLNDLAGLRLPDRVPSWVDHLHQLEVICPDGNKRFVRLDALEAMLSPSILALPGRPSVIVPIRPRYSEALLGGSRQLSLAPLMHLEATPSRMYLADPRTAKQYTKGGLVLFYESGPSGEMAIVAIARVIDVYLIQQDEADAHSLRSSVLDAETLSDIGKSKTKCACVFDNLIRMKKPIGLHRLKSLGISASRLITACRLTEDQLKEIVREGFASSN